MSVCEAVEESCGENDICSDEDATDVTKKKV